MLNRLNQCKKGVVPLHEDKQRTPEVNNKYTLEHTHVPGALKITELVFELIVPTPFTDDV